MSSPTGIAVTPHDLPPKVPIDVPPPFIWNLGADHKGKPIDTIPQGYLEWFVKNGKKADHVDAARMELDRRAAAEAFQGELLKP